MMRLNFFVVVIGLLICTSLSQVTGSCPSGVWNATVCTCSTGMVQLNGKCVCDYGYFNSSGTCVKCGADNTYNGTNCAGGSSGCQAGYELENSQCALNWNVDNCGEGNYWTGLFCDARIATPVCRNGYTYSGVTCLTNFAKSCPSGQYHNGASCVPFQNPPTCTSSAYRFDSLTSACVFISSSTPNCTAQEYWDGSQCELTSAGVKCKPGFFFNGKRCALVSQGTFCLMGYKWSGNRCVVSNVTGPAGFNTALARGGINQAKGKPVSATGGIAVSRPSAAGKSGAQINIPNYSNFLNGNTDFSSLFGGNTASLVKNAPGPSAGPGPKPSAGVATGPGFGSGFSLGSFGITQNPADNQRIADILKALNGQNAGTPPNAK